MRYSFYLGEVLFPVTPARLEIKYGNKLGRIDLASGDEVVFPVKPGLAEISFTALLPRVKYPFAVYRNGFLSGGAILSKLQAMQRAGKPMRFIVLRRTADGRSYSLNVPAPTNMYVVFSELRIREDANEGCDIYVDIKLVQYRSFKAKKLDVNGGTNSATEENRGEESNVVPRSYTVVRGDCLWLIAHKFLGDGNRYPEIYRLNKAVIDADNKGTGNPVYTIYPGQVLRLP